MQPRAMRPVLVLCSGPGSRWPRITVRRSRCDPSTAAPWMRSASAIARSGAPWRLAATCGQTASQASSRSPAMVRAVGPVRGSPSLARGRAKAPARHPSRYRVAQARAREVATPNSKVPALESARASATARGSRPLKKAIAVHSVRAVAPATRQEPALAIARAPVLLLLVLRARVFAAAPALRQRLNALEPAAAHAQPRRLPRAAKASSLVSSTRFAWIPAADLPRQRSRVRVHPV
jgi:hypothetical protein